MDSGKKLKVHNSSIAGTCLLCSVYTFTVLISSLKTFPSSPTECPYQCSSSSLPLLNHSNWVRNKRYLNRVRTVSAKWWWGARTHGGWEHPQKGCMHYSPHPIAMSSVRSTQILTCEFSTNRASWRNVWGRQSTRWVWYFLCRKGKVCSKTNGDMSKNTEVIGCSTHERNPIKSLHSRNCRDQTMGILSEGSMY